MEHLLGLSVGPVPTDPDEQRSRFKAIDALRKLIREGHVASLNIWTSLQVEVLHALLTTLCLGFGGFVGLTRQKLLADGALLPLGAPRGDVPRAPAAPTPGGVSAVGNVMVEGQAIEALPFHFR